LRKPRSTIRTPEVLTEPPPAAAAVVATASGVRVELPEGGVPFEVLEKAILERAMALSQGNITHAAKLLELSRDTLRYRLRKHGLEAHLAPGEGG